MSSRKCDIVWERHVRFIGNLLVLLGFWKLITAFIAITNIEKGCWEPVIFLVASFGACQSCESQNGDITESWNPNWIVGLYVVRPTASPFVFPKMWTQTPPKQTFFKKNVQGLRVTDRNTHASRTMWSTWESPALQVVPNWKWCRWPEPKWPFQPGGPGGLGGPGDIYFLGWVDLDWYRYPLGI